jgi:hypothetical protein
MMLLVAATGRSLGCYVAQCDLGPGTLPNAAIIQSHPGILVLPEQLTNALAETLNVGTATMIMKNATALALVVSLGLLWLYRRAVLKSMRARTSPRTIEPTPPETSTTSTSPNRPAQETAPDLSLLGGASPVAIGLAAEALHSRLLRTPWRTAAIYAGAGFCYALVIAAAVLTSEEAWDTSFYGSLLQFLLLFWTYAWPVVLTISIVAAANWRARLAVATGYFTVLAAISALFVARSPEALSLVGYGGISLPLFGNLQLPYFQVPGLALVWLHANLVVTVLVLAFLYRRVRAVGPLVLAFMVVSVTGSQFATPIAFNSNERLTRFLDNIGQTLGYGFTYRVLNILGFALAALLVGWLVLRWIRRRYEHKKVSDQSLTLDAVWLVYTVYQALFVSFAGPSWILSSFVAFAVYKAAAWASFRTLGYKPPTEGNPKLLLLRVFSLGRRSERLFDALAKHWRYLGDIRFIAGPDLATSTVEPHEFLDFLTGKLARRFIDGPKTLDLRISEMNLRPDADGRFRVNDFFCHDDAWQMTLSRLLGDSDAVLMDLRGFSRHNAGVAYEINELINVVPLERVVFVVDDTTDEQFLRQTVRNSWGRMSSTSPNRSSMPGRISVFRFTGSHGGELRRFLRTLSGAARPTASAEGDRPAPIRWPVPTALIAVFVFVVAVLVYAGTAMFTRDPLFSDDFSASTRWPEESGKHSGSYYGSDSGVDTYNMYASPGSWEFQLAPEVGPIKDAQVRASAILVSGRPDSALAGVVCRAQDKDNYYLLAVSYVGYATIQKGEDGKWKELAGAIYPEPIGGTNSKGGEGTLIDIRGDCVGDKLTLYVEEQKILEAEDSTFEAGEVGLHWENWARSNAAPRAEGAFSSFEVYAP